MLTTFDSLPTSLVTLLAQLVQKIASTIHPEKILCYGYRTSIYHDWSCFKVDTGYQATIKATFDLLVITNNDNTLADHELLQKIDLLAAPSDCEVTAVVQSLEAAIELIAKNSRFLNTIYHKAVLVYDAGNSLISAPPAAPTFEGKRHKLETTWNKCFTVAERFYKTACFCLDNGWNEKAMFDLHQATQHTCMALLRIYTGYRSTTHNLARLLALIENFSFVPSTIFPCSTEEETALFNTLNRAYSDARYKEDYIIPIDVAAVLKKRVHLLLDVAEKLYNKKMIELQNNRNTTFPLTPIDTTA
jgi:HEPN domain-containing protein